MPERPFPWLGRKHRDNTLTLKRFSSGVGFWCLGGAAAKNYREKSVDVVCYDELSSFEPDVEKEGSPTLLGISVLRALYGQNPFAARRLKSKVPARSKKRPTSRRISCVSMCPARTVGRRSI
ncbi:terminase large subunit of prophage CP-933O [Escherichia coli]|uniref:Terminase large subunit of prophage CP-933O n=1 Tax=Escherichia coli TaxID=562 RepID=A0A376ZED7_ECOLX|nr:terminase large subunit of prophage CP-933O [Escherichia coli]